MTDVARNDNFACDLLFAGGCKKPTAFATCDIPCTCNGLLATVYLKWLTCDANFFKQSAHMRYHMTVYEVLNSMVKSAGKSYENWLRYEMIASKIFSMLKLLLQAYTSNSNVQLQFNHK